MSRRIPRARFPSALALAFAFASVSTPSTALEWDCTEQNAVIKPFQSSLELRFPFHNTGSEPVRIIDVQTNCDCTTAQLDKKVYAPGEAGTLNATFIVGDRFGRYERVITVLTSDQFKPARLTITIDAPELAQVAPRILNWTVSAPPTEQSAIITVAEGLTLDFTEIFAINDQFKVRLERMTEGRRYRVHVQPVATTAPSNTAIRVVGHDSAGHELVVSLYANVR